MNKGGLCESCIAPGSCCKQMHLTGGVADQGARLGQPMSREKAEHLAMLNGLHTFFPVGHHHDGSWEFACTALQLNGRCGIYEDRPQLCRTYAAGSDPLCVHYFSSEVPVEAC